MILAGEELTFAANADGVSIERLLEAGKQYQLRENEAPVDIPLIMRLFRFRPDLQPVCCHQVGMTNEKIRQGS